MPAEVPLYQDVVAQIERQVAPQGVPKAARTRLALLVTGMAAAQTSVVARIATKVEQLGLTRATDEESVARRLRRTLSDPRLTPERCYEPVLGQVLDWDQLARERPDQPVVLAVDESSHTDRIHLFRVSLPYRGGALPLAWALWPQNEALPEGTYWREVDAVLERVAPQLPPARRVVVVADAAYPIPPFIDRLETRGWHWVLRVRLAGSHRLRDARGREWRLGDFVAHRLRGRRRRWKGRVWVFKDAGWREVSLVALWAPGAKEPLVVLSDLPPRWELLRHYDRRFWVEPGFRSDKSRGWRWEDSQVRGLAHHAVLLLAMAWATLLTLGVGVAQAQARLARLARRPLTPAPGRRRLGRPRHARQSLFTLGLRALDRWLSPTAPGPLPWALPLLDARSWYHQWYHVQAMRYIFQPVRP